MCLNYFAKTNGDKPQNPGKLNTRAGYTFEFFMLKDF